MSIVRAEKVVALNAIVPELWGYSFKASASDVSLELHYVDYRGQQLGEQTVTVSSTHIGLYAIPSISIPANTSGIVGKPSTTLLVGRAGLETGGGNFVTGSTTAFESYTANTLIYLGSIQPPATSTINVANTVTIDSEITTADLDTGAGTDTRAVVGLVLAASGGALLVGSANPVPISDNAGSITVDNAGTFATQATQAGTWTVQPGNTANSTAWLITQAPNTDASVLTSSARTVATNSSDQINLNCKSVLLFLNVTAASGTGGLTLRITGKDSISGNYFALNAAPTGVTATGQYAYVLGPGCSSAGGAIAQATAGILPKIWRVEIAVGDASSYTYSVGSSVIN